MAVKKSRVTFSNDIVDEDIDEIKSKFPGDGVLMGLRFYVTHKTRGGFMEPSERVCDRRFSRVEQAVALASYHESSRVYSEAICYGERKFNLIYAVDPNRRPYNLGTTYSRWSRVKIETEMDCLSIRELLIMPLSDGNKVFYSLCIDLSRPRSSKYAAAERRREKESEDLFELIAMAQTMEKQRPRIYSVDPSKGFKDLDCKLVWNYRSKK